MRSKALFEIKDVFCIEGRGCVVIGFLKSGTIMKGSKTILNNKEATILSIESHRQNVDTFSSIEESVALTLSDVTKEDISKGDIFFE
ncbi:MAG: hypothetical protein HZA35_02130 [Parcubacteria group bacterium]|nr:hypothetical protein [Parcubacteria group bacterium]